MKQGNFPQCKYNAAVDCDRTRRKCEKCGWNPKVESQRKRRLGNQPPHSGKEGIG